MTSVARVKPVRFPAEPRAVSSLSTALVLPRMTASAGTRPNTSPVTSASSVANASTAGFSEAPAIPGT